MISLIKAIPVGILLAFIVALFIGSGGSTGGLLNVHSVTFESYEFFWSWPLFLLGTGLSFGLFLMMK